MPRQKQILAVASISVISLAVASIVVYSLLEAWKDISELQSEVDSLSASLIELEERVRALEGTEPELIGHWSFDEGIGTTAGDSSGNNNNGTIYGAAWVDGKIGKALNFDGNDDYISIAHSSSLEFSDSVTVAGWIKIEGATGDHQVILAKHYGDLYWSSYVLEVQPDGQTPQFCLFSASGPRPYAVSNVAIQFGEWVHIAGTYDGSVVRIYVNGDLTGTAEHSEPIDVENRPVLIASHAASWDKNWFKGLIDDVRIYNGALSAEEIEALHQP